MMFPESRRNNRNDRVPRRVRVGAAGGGPSRHAPAVRGAGPQREDARLRGGRPLGAAPRLRRAQPRRRRLPAGNQPLHHYIMPLATVYRLILI